MTTKAITNDAPTASERVGYLGGSDAAALLGLSPWTTPFGVFVQKRGLQTTQRRIDDALQEKFDFGHAMEPVIARAFSARTGLHVALVPQAFLRSEAHPFAAGHLDYTVAVNDTATPHAFLECKNVEYRDKTEWLDPDPEGRNDASIPPYYLAQCDHYFLITGYAEAYLAVLFGGCRLAVYGLRRNPEREQILLEVERRFWERVEHDDPPDFSGNLDDLTLALRARYLKGLTAAEAKKSKAVVQLDKTASVLLERIGALRRAIKTARNEEYATVSALLQHLGGRTGYLHVGEEKWGSLLLQERRFFDDFALRMEHPDICAKYDSKRLIGPVLRLRSDDTSDDAK